MDRPIDAPPLRWFLQGAERRKLARRYWIYDTFWGLFYLIAHHALRLAPLDVITAIGSWYGDLTRRHVGFDIGNMRRYRIHEARARENWLRLRPRDNDPEQVETAMDTAFRNAGSTYCEFAALNRLWPQGRIEMAGTEHLDRARAAKRPILVAGTHLGNWEVLGPALVCPGYGCLSVYQQPANRFDHAIAVNARQGYGVKLIPPGRGGGRIAHKALMAAEEVVVIYVDECIEGVVYAPFFGRPPRYDGNLAYATRLAMLTDAVVIPSYCTRLDGARFRMTFLPPVEIAKTGNRDADVVTNVAALNAAIEAPILAHLEQWLWLFDLKVEDVPAAARHPH